MNSKYKEKGYQAVFRDSSKNGLLFEFLTEYKATFGGGKLNPNCSSCRAEYWDNYLNLFTMATEKKSSYLLKAKYNGINLTPQGRPLRNGEMTDEQAKELLEKHPAGASLFDFIPETPIKEVKKPTRKRKNLKK